MDVLSAFDRSRDKLPRTLKVCGLSIAFFRFGCGGLRFLLTYRVTFLYMREILP